MAQPEGAVKALGLDGRGQLRMVILDNTLDNMTTYGRYKSP